MRVVDSQQAFDSRPVRAFRRDGDRLLAYTLESGVESGGQGAGTARWFHRIGDEVNPDAQFVDDGRRVLAMNGMAVDLLDADTGALVASIDRARPLTARPSARYFAAGARLVDARTGCVVGEASVSAISGDGTRGIERQQTALIVVDGIGGTLATRRWEADEIGRARSIRISRAGHLVYACGYLAIVVFDIETGREFGRVITTGAGLESIAIDDADTVIAVADKRGEVSLYEPSGNLVWKHEAMRGEARTAVRFTASGDIAVSNPRETAVLDRKTGTRVAEPPAPDPRFLRWTRRALVREVRVIGDKLVLGERGVLAEIPGATADLGDGLVARVVDRENVELTRGAEVVRRWSIAGEYADCEPMLSCDGATLRAWRNCFDDSDDYHEVRTLALASYAESEPENRAGWLLAAEPPFALYQYEGKGLELVRGEERVDALAEIRPRPAAASTAAFAGDGVIVVGCTDGACVLAVDVAVRSRT